MRRLFLIIFVFLLLVGCRDQNVTDSSGDNIEATNVTTAVIMTTTAPTTTTAPMVTEAPVTTASVYDLKGELGTFEVVRAFESLVFDRPLFLTSANEEKDLIYVVEKKGIIWVFENALDVSDKQVFLDMSGKVSSTKSEEGLLGFVFHPDFINQPYIYVNYTVNQETVVSRLTVTDAGVDLASELVMLRYKQPFSNHNGGDMAFGEDGYLYIASGDGGSAGDPQNNSQNLSNLLGKILRIDVENSSSSAPYHIPADNPFAGNDKGYAQEIYAFGLRNPWRMSFDYQRGLLLAADVGQDKREEINVIVSGGNYGWAKYEGRIGYKDIALASDEAVMPVWEYEHSLGKSVTGGYTYYGQALPGLYGWYVYGDFISGRIWGLWLDENGEATNELLAQASAKIASFGLDDQGEIYIVDYQGGIYRLEHR